MAHAHGKCILIGEHSVVYGSKSIAIPLVNAQVNINAIKYPIDYIESPFYTGNFFDMPEQLLSIKSLFEKLKETLKLPTLKLTLDNHIPVSAGLGASAAIAAALIKTLYAFAEIELTEEMLLESIDYAERISHGKASGIDARAVSSNHTFIFEKGNMTPIKMNLDAYLLVVHSNIAGRTKEAVSVVRKGLVDKEKEAALKALFSYTETAIDAIKQKDITTLGQTLTAVHHKLSALGVSNKTLDHMVQLALENGAFGAKLTGGGLGGCMLALCNKKTLDILKDMYKREGYHIQFVHDLKEAL